MSKATRYTITVAARLLRMTYNGARKLIAEGKLEEAGDVRGIRTVTAESLCVELERRGLPVPREAEREGNA
jgi:hypothetical protein